jgi:hypothetical protein
MKGSCLTRGKGTYACSSLGFRNENMNMSVDTNCKKGGSVCL